MATTQTSQNESLNTRNARIVAFFKNKEDAYRAVGQLRDLGFTSDEIGFVEGWNGETGVQAGTRDSGSVWQKIKDFFTGDSHDHVDYDSSTETMDWDPDRANYYYQGIEEGGALVSVTGTRSGEARRILQNAGGDLRETGFEKTAASPSSSASGEERRIQLRGEILHTYKDRVKRGEVRLRKEVITENQTMSVPVTREELVIERTPASGQSASGGIGTDQEIRVPLSEERARAEKQPVVTEEVRVGKRAVQNTEQVSDNVRHEELRVDKEGDVDVSPDVTQAGKRKKPAA
jgi:uncharacterized protein (TIGR02271 family)